MSVTRHTPSNTRAGTQTLTGTHSHFMPYSARLVVLVQPKNGASKTLNLVTNYDIGLQVHGTLVFTHTVSAFFSVSLSLSPFLSFKFNPHSKRLRRIRTQLLNFLTRHHRFVG